MDTHFANLLIESISNSKSPKMALDGAKSCLSGSEEYTTIFRACFDLSWKDAKKRNRVIENSQGKLHNAMWPQRQKPLGNEMNEVLNYLKAEKKDAKLLGEVLMGWDVESVAKVLSEVRASL